LAGVMGGVDGLSAAWAAPSDGSNAPPAMQAAKVSERALVFAVFVFIVRLLQALLAGGYDMPFGTPPPWGVDPPLPLDLVVSEIAVHWRGPAGGDRSSRGRGFEFQPVMGGG
jgi:hypothetical protein